MRKKVLSAVLALTLVFGSAAVLPQGTFTDSTSITAVAAGDKLVSGDYEYRVVSGDTVEIAKYNGSAKTLEIPSTIAGKKVTSIGQSAFSMNTTVTNAKIPDTVTSIAYSAFVGSALSKVTLSSNLKTIGQAAFASTKLESVTIPASVTVIGKNAFEKCGLLTKVDIPAGAYKTIDNEAFKECLSLATVTIGSTVTSIGTSAFESCKALTSLTVSASVKSINQAAFKGCKKLTTANLGNGVETIAANAFLNCSALRSVKFGTSLKSIGNSAFEDCTSLTSVTLMPSTKEIGEAAFSGCSAMSKAVLSGVEVIYPKAFSYCSDLTTVVFCEDIRSIGEDVFLNCGKYTDAYIPDDSLEQIQEHAFGYVYDSTTQKYGRDPLMTIHSGKNSKAETYATRNSIKFVEVPSSHSPHTTESIVVPYTCTKDGSTITICKVCGRVSTTYIHKAEGHPSGTYYRTTAFDTNAKTSTQTGVCTLCGETVRKITRDAVSRLAGANRFETAAEIAKAGFPSGAKTVVLANGMNYADALAGVPLAKKLNAPILLTNTNEIDKSTLDEISRLGATKVYILGGTAAVSDKVVNDLKGKGLKTERLGGQTRFETATKIALKMQELDLNAAPSEVFFVFGGSFADALSVGSVAAIKGAPVIYLPTSGAMDTYTGIYLKKVMGRVRTAYVIGGDKIITEQMRKEVAGYLMLADSSVVRVAGRDRYETCVAVNDKFSSVLSTNGVCIAKGLDFPDALAGGVYAANTNQPLFLADGKTLSSSQSSYLKGKNPAKLTVIGGTGAVSDELLSAVAKASV